MPGPGKAGRYHHGDLRQALIGTAIEVIAERGVQGFSLAEASRRLGVAASAPYAHFADRDDLLAAVAVRAHEVFGTELLPLAGRFPEPAGQLAAMAEGYVRFAAAHRALFTVLYEAGLDKTGHPEIAAAERPVTDAFMAAVLALSPGGGAGADDLAAALEATAHGYAMLLLDSSPAPDEAAVEVAAQRAARAARALISSRHLLTGPVSPPVRTS